MKINSISPAPNTPTRGGGICLCMIVKDEQDVIERCLRSVRPHITSWCIVDTGSSDRTKELIVKAMEGVPGQLYEREWVDFATNRNQAWELALKQNPKYLMFIDADEELAVDGEIPKLEFDAYLISVHYNGTLENRFWMVRSDYPNRWTGQIHEDIPAHGEIGKVLGCFIVSHIDGARAKDPRARTNSDLEVLHRLINENPDDPRLWYYLGATYAVGKNFEQAYKAFKRRAEMGGNERELWKARSFCDQYTPQEAAC